MSRKCHAKGGKRRQKCGKRQQMKEKVGCGNLPQLAEFVRLATPLARFGKVVRTASKQRVGSSNLPGRATYFRKSVSWRSHQCCPAISFLFFGNTWGQLLVEQADRFSLRNHSSVCIDFESRRHVRMPELCLSNFQRCSLDVQECAVSMAKNMPIDSWQSCAFARGL